MNNSHSRDRLSLGVVGLDPLLGGGLLPGTLTVIAGATGIGKTQLGLQFAHVGVFQEGRRGVILDMTSRGDSQNHAEYAKRMFGWEPRTFHPGHYDRPAQLFDPAWQPGEYLRAFSYQGRRVSRGDLDVDAWHDWQAELGVRLAPTITFLYGNFIRGARRVVMDGIEPVDRPADSIQFHLAEYVYHQVLRKDHDWLARDVLRQDYRRYEGDVFRHPYAFQDVACLLLATCQEAMLDDLISRPLAEGDLLSNANTVIYLGKIRDGRRLSRGLYIAKHRGSACHDEIVPYRITDSGLTAQPTL